MDIAKNILYGFYYKVNINPVSSINFKGYDARPLRAVVMRNAEYYDLSEAARQMSRIGAKHGFKLIYQDKLDCKRPWIQDVLYFIENKMLINKCEGSIHDMLCSSLGFQKTEISDRNFVKGGNLFITENNGRKRILAGRYESKGTIKKMFPNAEIIKLPQADFHIDLFVRPLKDDIVLVADDDMTLNILQNAKLKLEKLIGKNSESKLESTYQKLGKLIEEMRSGRKFTLYQNTNSVISVLEKNNFKVIRTPGRIYKEKPHFLNFDTKLINRLNFINAVTLTDKNGEIVYISNKSNLMQELGLTPEIARQTGLDFEYQFKKAVKNYIKPKNIYFLEGGKKENDGLYKNIPHILEELQGGIHCLCAEIPE